MIQYGKIIQADTLDHLWLLAYKQLSKNPKVEQARHDNIIGEIIDAKLILENPTKNIMLNEKRKLNLNYAIGELLWYESANKNLSGIQLYTKNWDNLSDDGTTVNSNYGYCIQEKFGFNQFDYVYNLLVQDKNTKQAIIQIKRPELKESKDINCTLSLQFLIRENELLCITTMRSNDIWLGTPYDIFYFTCLQIKLAMKLGLKLGRYIHNVGSLHLYQKDYIKAGDING